MDDINIPLKPEEYNTYVKLINSYGTDKPDGLRRELKSVMESDAYDAMSDEAKTQMISDVISYAREMARYQIIEMYPEVKKYKENKITEKFYPEEIAK